MVTGTRFEGWHGSIDASLEMLANGVDARFARLVASSLSVSPVDRPRDASDALSLL